MVRGKRETAARRDERIVREAGPWCWGFHGIQREHKPDDSAEDELAIEKLAATDRIAALEAAERAWAEGTMRFSRKIRVDARYSVALTYSWLRRCGLTRRDCLERILREYGW